MITKSTIVLINGPRSAFPAAARRLAVALAGGEAGMECQVAGRPRPRTQAVQALLRELQR
jgi:hypothetical protein